jgi:hydroxymethylglutaryl-CoA synthase
MTAQHPLALGIHDLAIATGHHVLDLDDLAAANGVDPAKYHVGIGQDAFSVPAPDEDIVTMGAAAAKQVLDRHGVDGIRTVLFATESGVDQSKAAGVYVHGLLGLPRNVRVVELKQACYGGTAAVQMALGIIARDPGERVLVIAATS